MSASVLCVNRRLLISSQEHGFYVAYRCKESGLLVDTCNSGSEIINVLKKSENSQNFHKLLLIEEQTDAELLEHRSILTRDL
jgi:hypothetical protein